MHVPALWLSNYMLWVTSANTYLGGRPSSFRLSPVAHRRCLCDLPVHICLVMTEVTKVQKPLKSRPPTQSPGENQHTPHTQPNAFGVCCTGAIERYLCSWNFLWPATENPNQTRLHTKGECTAPLAEDLGETSGSRYLTDLRGNLSLS